MNFIKITLSNDEGSKSYSEIIKDSKYHELLGCFNELKSNGANPDLDGVEFSDYVRPMKSKCVSEKIDSFNGNHFIYGWLECFIQSDDFQSWMLDSEKITVEVENNIG
jgi:hypothetical protein